MSDEDDPELWGAIHRLACILDNLHEDEMLRTDVRYSDVTGLIVKGTKIVGQAKDRLNGLRTAPPDYGNMSTLLKTQGEADAALKEAKSKLETEEKLYKQELDDLKQKHQPLINSEKNSVQEAQNRLIAAEKAIHNLNEQFTREEKEKERKEQEQRRNEKLAADLKAKADAAAVKAAAGKSK